MDAGYFTLAGMMWLSYFLGDLTPESTRVHVISTSFGLQFRSPISSILYFIVAREFGLNNLSWMFLLLEQHKHISFWRVNNYAKLGLSNQGFYCNMQ